MTRCIAADDRCLRQVLARNTASLAVITACQRGVPVGVLVSSLASVSTHPPVVSFNISSTSFGWSALEQAAHVGIHLLAADQEDLADRFSAGRSDGFASPSSWRSGPYGVPLLTGCAAWTVAQPTQRIHTGAQVIIVARLLEGDTDIDVSPLLEHAGTYRRLAS